MSCPVGCPLAWRAPGKSTCPAGRFRRDVPANDCLSVSPRCRVRRAGVVDAGWSVVGLDGGGDVRRGVACCPLARPLSWTSDPLAPPYLHLAHSCALPTK